MLARKHASKEVFCSQIKYLLKMQVLWQHNMYHFHGTQRPMKVIHAPILF